MVKRPDDVIMREGAQRLQDWLPEARRAAEHREFTEREASSLGEATSAYLTEARLKALVIYPAPKGGWHADICLRDMPPGFPDVMGTPVGQPCKTREEAEQTGRDMLVNFLMEAKRNQERTAPAPAPVFLFYNWSFRLNLLLDMDPSMVQALSLNEGYGSHEATYARIDAVVARFASEGCVAEKFGDWPVEAKRELVAVLHVAALGGVFRYPAMQDASPSGHRDSSQARH